MSAPVALSRDETLRAIAAGEVTRDVARSILTHLQAAMATAHARVYEDLSDRFAFTVQQVVAHKDPRERMILVELLDGAVDAASARYDRLIDSSVTTQKADRLIRKGVLFTPTHPRIAKAAFERLLAVRPDHEEAQLGLGLALEALGDWNAARKRFLALLGGPRRFYDYRKVTPLGNALAAGIPHNEALRAEAASNGLWRVRHAQQLPRWPAFAFRAAGELRDWAVDRLPRIRTSSRRRSTGRNPIHPIAVWDIVAAAAITFEAASSLNAALRPYTTRKYVTDALLAPAPAPYRPAGPNVAPDSARWDRAEGFTENWNNYRSSIYGDCERAFITRMSVVKVELEAYKSTEDFARMARFIKEENATLGRWVLSKNYDAEPQESEADLVAFGREIERAAQRYACMAGDPEP